MVSPKKIVDSIADSLNVAPKEVTLPVKKKTSSPKNVQDFTIILEKNKFDDYTKIRDNISHLLNLVEGVLDETVIEARSNISPRIVEALCQLVNVYLQANDKMLDITKDLEKKDVSPDEQNGIGTINNVIFSGTRESLLDFIKSQK